MGDAAAIASAVRSSLLAIHSHNATPQSIKKSEKCLLDATAALKGLNPAVSVEVFCLLNAPLLSPSIEILSAKQFSLAELNHGFYILDEVLFRAKVPWASFPDEIRTSVRQVAVKLFQNASEVHADGSRVYGFPVMVQEKITSLLSALAIREWPQRWNTFLDELLSEPQRAETCCHVLRVLSEEVYDYGTYIDSKRREELIHALALTLSQTLGFVTSAAEVFSQQKNYNGLNIALDTIHAFLSWASLDDVFSAHVPDACFLLLRVPETRDRALSALTKLVRRNFSQAGYASDRKQGAGLQERKSEAQFCHTVFYGLLKFVMESRIRTVAAVSLFPPTRAIVPILADSYEVVVGDLQKQDIANQDEHEFQVAFFTMLSHLGSSNFCSGFLISKQKGPLFLSAEEQQCAAAFVECMLCAAASPSCAIRLAVVPFFTECLANITKNRHVVGGSFPPQNLARFIVTGYLQSASLALIRFPQNVDSVTALYDELDFEDDLRREKDRHENLVSRTVSAMTRAAKLCPDFAYSASLRRMVTLLSGKPTRGRDAESDLKSFASVKSEGFIVPDGNVHGWEFGNFVATAWKAWECCLDATITATEAVIIGVHRSYVPLCDSAREEMNELMLKSFQLVMHIKEGPLLSHKSHILRILFPLYIAKPQLLDLTFAELIFQGTNVPGNCRNRACLAMSVICKRLLDNRVTEAEQYREAMCNYTAQALPDSSFGSRNKVHLLEASISIIFASGTFHEQQDFVERLMDLVLCELESEKTRHVLQNPVALAAFVSEGDRVLFTHIVEAFQLMESGTHLIVKTNSVVPNVLSRTIAPRCVESAGVLVRTLHGLYNSTKFPLDDQTGARKQMLLPTSREITALLNLENSSRVRRERVDEKSKLGDDIRLGTLGEQLSSQILRQYAIESPDPIYNHAREVLKTLRKSAYEMMRSAVFSGVTNSEVHLRCLVSALTSDCYHLEPIHLVEVTRKVLRPLLSHTVMAAGSGYLEILERSGLPNLLNVIQEHIESAKLGEIVESVSATVDIARDYGRKCLARSAVDLLQDMYPPLISRKGRILEPSEAWLPPVLDLPIVGSKLRSIWRVICSPGQGFLDSTTANMGFKLVTSSAAIAPIDRFDLFGHLLEASFRTSLENRALKGDSPFDHATGAMLAVMRKWPVESKAVLEAATQRYEQVSTYVAECIEAIAQSSQHSSKPKKHKVYVVEMINKIAEFSGADSRPHIKVASLPEKLITNNPARNANKPRHELEEIVLGDAALDSLFGDGNPL